MSSPEKVRTSDGMVWERRAETRSGLALYALEGVCSCPPYVMATLPELAEHGIQSSELAAVVAELGALPMPVGSPAEEPIAYALTEQAEELCDHPNGYGPYGCAACGAFAPADGEDDVRPQVRKLRALLAVQRTAVEDQYASPLRHDYRLGRDLPEMGGA